MAATDWSEVFEKRLMTALSEDKEENITKKKRSRLLTDLDLTPPPTIHKPGEPSHVHDPTAAFFDSIRKPTRVSDDKGNRTRKSPRHGGGPVTPTTEPKAQGSQPAIEELQKSYSNRAKHLHKEAMDRLDEVEATLEKQLASMERDENKFVATMANKQTMYSKPASEWTVKIQTRATAGDDERVVEHEERIVDRIAAIRASAATLETNLERLWREWDEAQMEVMAALGAIFGNGEGEPNSYGSAKTGKGSAEMSDGIDAIIKEAEKELQAAAAEAMRDMKENEKSFRKLILAEECKLAQDMLARQSKYD